MKMPTHRDLMNPTLEALRILGGSATKEELAAQVLKVVALPPEIVSTQHGTRGQTEIEYRLAWACSYLKRFGLLENSSRGVWALTAGGREAQRVDPREVSRHMRGEARRAAEHRHPEAESEEVVPDVDWRDELLTALLSMPPDGFERLCQRVLRESGFVEVVVTGKTGDGGIDGQGILRLAGMISFRVAFQAKRYQANIGAGIVRDFRGAMVGRADKGVIITTAGFTLDAQREAVRDGAPPIDLISGDELVTKLKELRLGVRVTPRTVEDVAVDSEWFRNV